MGCGTPDGDLYPPFLSLTALGLGVRVLVATAIEDDVMAITRAGAGMWRRWCFVVGIVVVHAQLLGAIMVVNGEVRRMVIHT